MVYKEVVCMGENLGNIENQLWAIKETTRLQAVGAQLSVLQVMLDVPGERITDDARKGAQHMILDIIDNINKTSEFISSGKSRL